MNEIYPPLEDMHIWEEYVKRIPKNAPRRRLRAAAVRTYPTILDLHGFSLDEGYGMLRIFLANNFLQKSAAVLIITGNSQKEQSFKHKVPRWLKEKAFQPYVGSVEQAHPSQGGAGALVVRMKKDKNKPVVK